MVLAVEQLRAAPLKADVKAALVQAIDTQKAILKELARADATRGEPQDRQQQLTIALPEPGMPPLPPPAIAAQSPMVSALARSAVAPGGSAAGPSPATRE